MANIILWLSIIWLSPLMYVFLGNEAKFKKNIAVGVTIPFEGRTDPEVTARLSRFKKELAAVCVLLVLLAVPGFFIKNGDLNFTLWFIWLDLCVFLPIIPYVLCNRDLKRLKRDRGWNINGGQTVTVDTAAIHDEHWLSPWLFVPAVILCLLPLAWDRDFLPMYLIDAACVVLYWLCYRYLYRNRAELVDQNTELTNALTRIRRRNWAKMWLVLAYSMSLIGLCAVLTPNYPKLSTLMIFVFTLVICAASFCIEFGTRRAQEKLTAESGKDWYVDEDDLWIGGMIYYNPNDSRNIINDRVGTNSSFNAAKPLGKIVISLTLLLLLALPFTNVFIGGIGTKPMDLSMDESQLISYRGSKEYVIPLENIASVELLDALPEKLSRTFGTGMPNLLEGNFSSPELGSMKLRLDPQCPPYLLIFTDSGQTYLLGTRSSEQTAEIYSSLSKVIN